MKMRTRIQESRYGQALGYGWGQKDAARYMSTDSRPRRLNLTADVLSFATFYAIAEDMTSHHYTLEKAWDYFVELKLDEQKAYGTEWMRRPWSMYEEMTNSNG